MRRSTTTARKNGRKNTTKILASVVLVAGAASVAGLGTFGSFTSTTSASQDVTSGKIELSLAQGAVATTVPAVGLVPGDTVQRTVTLSRGSDNENFGGVTLTTTASPSSVLDTDATNGLQLKVEQCGTAWTQAGSTKTFTCAGGATTVVGQRAVIGSNLPTADMLSSLNGASKTAFLRLTLSLPTTADNTFQGKSSTIKFTFDATQRTREDR